MTKIIATWNETLSTVPSDDKIEEWLKNRIAEFNLEKDMKEYSRIYFEINSQTQVNALRLAVLRKEIRPEDIEFEYNGIDISINEKGLLSEWPKGFADLAEEHAMEMIDLRISLREKQND